MLIIIISLSLPIIVVIEGKAEVNDPCLISIFIGGIIFGLYGLATIPSHKDSEITEEFDDQDNISPSPEYSTKDAALGFLLIAVIIALIVGGLYWAFSGDNGLEYEVGDAQGERAGLIGYDTFLPVRNVDTEGGYFTVTLKIVTDTGEKIESYAGAPVSYVGATPSESDWQEGSSVTLYIGPGEEQVFYFGYVIDYDDEIVNVTYDIDS